MFERDGETCSNLLEKPHLLCSIFSATNNQRIVYEKLIPPCTALFWFLVTPSERQTLRPSLQRIMRDKVQLNASRHSPFPQRQCEGPDSSQLSVLIPIGVS